MFGIGTFEIVIILLIALLILGPKKLPELVKSISKGIREFRRSLIDGGQDDNSEIQNDKKNNSNVS